MLKITGCSRVRSTSEDACVFKSRDEIYFVLILKKKSKFSFNFILFIRFTVDQLTVLRAKSQSNKRQQTIICDEIPGSSYSYCDLQLKKRN